MAGAPPSAHTRQVQVWDEPNISLHPRSHHSLLLATVPGQANAFNGTAWRSLYNRLPFHGRLCWLVPGEGHPGLGIQGGHLQRNSLSCTHCRASHHGLPGKGLRNLALFLDMFVHCQNWDGLVSVVVVGDARSLKHQANSLSGWDSSPPCKRCGFRCPPSHASVTCSGPPIQ